MTDRPDLILPSRVDSNELARQCRQLGYSIETVRNEKGIVEGFEIKGVSRDIQERFSKRRGQLEQRIAGLHGTDGRGGAGRHDAHGQHNRQNGPVDVAHQGILQFETFP